MNIILYKTNSPRNKLNKNLVSVANITGESNNSLDKRNISFILSKTYLTNVQNSNFLYCTDTAKYYYIEDYEIKNQTVKINCKEDVLMTYKTQILSQTCTISKNEKNSNSYLYDDGYQLLAYKNIVTKTFPHGLDDNSIILMTVG